MQTKLYIQGPYTLGAGTLRFSNVKQKQPMLVLFKDEIAVAVLYYHLPAKQIVLRVEDGVNVTKGTIDKISEWELWDHKVFKLVYKRIKKEREAQDED